MTGAQGSWIIVGIVVALAQLACPAVRLSGRTIEGDYLSAVTYPVPLPGSRRKSSTGLGKSTSL